MSPLEILYYTLTIGFVVLVIFISYAFYEFSKTLRSARDLIENVDDITRDVSNVKNTFKSGILGVAAMVLNTFLRRR